MRFFEKFLTLWVLLAMVLGVAIQQSFPSIPRVLGEWQVSGINLPIAALIWLMIFPMMLKVDFESLLHVGRQPQGLFLTWIVNWAIKPFSMFLIALFFFEGVFARWMAPDVRRSYLAGAVLLGAAPCTAMVFVWSHLTRGNPGYTVVQVASNDLIILIAFAPIVAFLLGVSGVSVPWETLLLSVLLFVVVPLVGGAVVRHWVVSARGIEFFEHRFLPKFDGITVVSLLLTLVLIFSYQGRVIVENPVHILMIAVPLVLQTFVIFFLSYGGACALRLPHSIAAPAGMIGASNFFELAVAVAIALFGPDSPAALATVVGVLVEVPVMLSLVAIANRTVRWFPESKQGGTG